MQIFFKEIQYLDPYICIYMCIHSGLKGRSLLKSQIVLDLKKLRH